MSLPLYNKAQYHFSTQHCGSRELSLKSSNMFNFHSPLSPQWTISNTLQVPTTQLKIILLPKQLCKNFLHFCFWNYLASGILSIHSLLIFLSIIIAFKKDDKIFGFVSVQTHLILCFYLLLRARKRERDRFNVLAHSLDITCQRWDWAGNKAIGWELNPSLPHGWQEPNSQSHRWCLLGLPLSLSHCASSV